MLAYLDSSVVLRVILDEPRKLREFHDVTQGVSSQILKLECLRSLDRLRQVASISEMELAEYRSIFYKIYNKLILIPVSSPILDLASQPFGFSLKSLDALHLVSCQFFIQTEKKSIPFFTHDSKLARVVKSVGINVLGIETM